MRFSLGVMAASGAASGPVLAFTDAVVDGADATTYENGDWDGVAIGAASATRRVIVGITWRQATTKIVTSITVGGVACTEVIAEDNTGSGAAIWISDAIAAGTTADVVVVFDSDVLRVGAAFWSVTGLASATAVDTATSTAEPGSLDSDFSALGVGVAVAFSAATDDTFEWTGMTERVTTSGIEANGSYSAADYTAAAAESGRTISVAYGTGSTVCATAATFR